MKHRIASLAPNVGRRSKAFTLIELLIVIGIIVLLIGILIPMVSRVRISVQTVSTRQMISRLEAGINAYYSDFGAYPGAFANSQVIPFSAATSINGQTPVPANVTSTENLYLSLAGGLGITATTASPPAVATFIYTAALGQNLNGPGNLNPGNVKRFGPYISLTANETSYPLASNAAQQNNTQGQWNVASGTLTGDTIVPEILDKYARPSPILYMRANRGAASEVSTGTVYDGTYQYQTATITQTYADQVATTNFTYPSAWPTNGSAFNISFPVSGALTAGMSSYIGNSAVSNTTAIPANKDGYILISAGPDGKYGTGDDITNFRQ